MTFRHKRPFEEVYEEYFSYVYNLIYMHVLHRQTAEDLTADAFTRAFAAYDRYDPSLSSEKTWLSVIANRLLYNHYRAKAANKVDTVEDEVLAFVPCPDDALEALADGTGEAVRQLLKLLSEEERRLLVMRYYMDMKNPDIAEQLGIAPKAVSERCRRLLLKCRKLMEENGLEEFL